MGATREQIESLSRKTPREEASWRIGSCGESARGPWAKLLTYVDARYVQRTLDDCVGPENWQTDVKEVSRGFLVGIGINVEGAGWVWKWDGAPEDLREPSQISETDAAMLVKGAISDALKRAAVHWGVARDLYEAGETWAQIVPEGTPNARAQRGWNKKENREFWFHWLPPNVRTEPNPEARKGEQEKPKF